MFYLCTYFDSHYLTRGLALYRSLVRHATPFRLWVLCFDDLTYEILQKLELCDVIPISQRDFEKEDRELLQAKDNRSRIEYYFTCTPSLPLYVLRHHPEVDVITYLDADLFFFSALSSVYQELDRGSVLLVGHRFPPCLRHLEDRGIYNVSLLSFRRDQVGLECLRWWRERCLEWCCDRVEDGRYADQKYLDDWPTRFSGVVVLQHKGAGLAPWNVGNYSLGSRDGHAFVDSQPLVFFHFHGPGQKGRWVYDPNLAGYGMHPSLLLKRYVYGPYIQELQETVRWVSTYVPANRFQLLGGSIRRMNPGGAARGNVLRRMARKVRSQLFITKRVLQGHLWVVIRGRVL